MITDLIQKMIDRRRPYGAGSPGRHGRDHVGAGNRRTDCRLSDCAPHEGRDGSGTDRVRQRHAAKGRALLGRRAIAGAGYRRNRRRPLRDFQHFHSCGFRCRGRRRSRREAWKPVREQPMWQRGCDGSLRHRHSNAASASATARSRTWESDFCSRSASTLR